MAVATMKKKPEPAAEPVVEPELLLPQVQQNPALIVQEPSKLPILLAEMKREIDAFVPDLTTAKGRDAISALAYKITRTKTAIDGAGKKINEDARAQIGVVDKIRRDVWDRLEALADEVRRPLDEWKEAEKARAERARTKMDELKVAAVVPHGATSDDVRARLAKIEAEEVTEAEFGEHHPIAVALRTQAIEALKTILTRMIHEEAERADLERLRKENAERLAAEQAARDRAERAKKAADEEAERQGREQRAAATAAAEAEERAVAKAREEQKKRDFEHAIEVARLQQIAADAEAARKADEQRQRDAAAAQAKREANVRHVGKVMREAKEALMKHAGVDEETAKTIVRDIKATSIPHVSIQF